MEHSRRSSRDLRRRTQHHLEHALHADDPSEKDYHIRSALQMVIISETDWERVAFADR